MRNINQIYVVNLMEELEKQQTNKAHGAGDYDIIINTHGDKVPYYHSHLSKDNTITYCHFPRAKYYIESENVNYLEKDLKIKIISSEKENYDLREPGYTTIESNKKKESFKILGEAYFNLMRNSTVITNSEFSRKAIFDAYGINNIYVLSPPVDVNIFRNAALISKEKKDIILVISRIDPDKEIENAISLAKILKCNNIGKGMRIVGSLYSYNFRYYSYLKKLVRDCGLKDYITFEPNVDLGRLLYVMQNAKVYFHPMVGEHFGMSVVEAMAAGLIPIVPNVGGPTEFVPKRYHFKTLEEAAHMISHAFSLSYEERFHISNSVDRFSTHNYIAGFQRLIKGLL